MKICFEGIAGLRSGHMVWGEKGGITDLGRGSWQSRTLLARLARYPVLPTLFRRRHRYRTY